MTNPKAGHTSATGYGANSQGLRDGDGLTSPSLTNLYEGLHGNGILRLSDGAKGHSLRNSVVSGTPGYITAGNAGLITVNGGYCKIDGILYKFAGGPGSTVAFTVKSDSNFSGDLPSNPSSNSEVFVVIYLVGNNSPKDNVMYEIGTPVVASAGTPLIPNRFLSDPSITANTDSNHHSSVLAVLRYTISTSGVLGNDPIIFDRRTFLDSAVNFLTPMTKAENGNTVYPGNSINSAADLDSFFAGNEGGNFAGSPFGAIWQSHAADVAGSRHAMVYAASPRNVHATPSTDTHVLGPNRVEVITTSGNVTFNFDQGNIWIITTDTNRTINPTNDFPRGHVIEIYHKAGSHTLHFDSTSGGHSTSTKINVDVGINKYGKFVYDGADWHKVDLHTVS